MCVCLPCTTTSKGLDGLHDDLALLAGRMLLDKIRQATFGKTGEEALRAMAHAYRQFAHEQPALYPLTTMAPDPDQAQRMALAQEWLQLLLLTMASAGPAGRRSAARHPRLPLPAARVRLPRSRRRFQDGPRPGRKL